MIDGFVNRLRESTAYPSYRGFVSTLTWLSYLIAAGISIFGLLGGFAEGNPLGVVISLVVGILLAVLATVVKEASLMLADIADATLLVASEGKNLPLSNARTPRPADLQR